MISGLIFSSFFYFPQEQIDKIFSRINSLSITSDSILSPVEALFKMFTRRPLVLKKDKSELEITADIIIGDTHNETLSVSGYFYNSGNIIIVNDGVLRLRNTGSNLDGNICVF
ncbi:MAG: hypothetical protein N3A65_10035 [candidate division WOR-3 bacterium]|nr:hypothetical protein [candidate division WOR-3 bacterium]